VSKRRVAMADNGLPGPRRRSCRAGHNIGRMVEPTVPFWRHRTRVLQLLRLVLWRLPPSVLPVGEVEVLVVLVAHPVRPHQRALLHAAVHVQVLERALPALLVQEAQVRRHDWVGGGRCG